LLGTKGISALTKTKVLSIFTKSEDVLGTAEEVSNLSIRSDVILVVVGVVN
jgi:hypothetical protein